MELLEAVANKLARTIKANKTSRNVKHVFNNVFNNVTEIKLLKSISIANLGLIVAANNIYHVLH